MEGTGKRGRHVKLRPGRDVDSAALAQLVDAAYVAAQRDELAELDLGGASAFEAPLEALAGLGRVGRGVLHLGDQGREVLVADVDAFVDDFGDASGVHRLDLRTAGGPHRRDDGADLRRRERDRAIH